MRKSLFFAGIILASIVLVSHGYAQADRKAFKQLPTIKKPSPTEVKRLAEGPRLPTTNGVITYWRHPKMRAWDKYMRQAHRAFAPAGIRFRRVSKRKNAQIVYTFKAKTCGSGGCAQIGYRHAGPTNVWLVPKTESVYRTIAIKHETAHALGLGHHDRSCSITNSEFNACLRSGEIAPIDRLALRQLYAQHNYKRLKNAVVNLSIEQSEPAGYWNIIHLRLNHHLVKTLRVTRSPGHCSKQATLAPAKSAVRLPYPDTDPRGLTRYHMPIDSSLADVPSGIYCYSIWPVNLHNQIGLPVKIQHLHEAPTW